MKQIELKSENPKPVPGIGVTMEHFRRPVSFLLAAIECTTVSAKKIEPNPSFQNYIHVNCAKGYPYCHTSLQWPLSFVFYHVCPFGSQKNIYDFRLVAQLRIRLT